MSAAPQRPRNVFVIDGNAQLRSRVSRALSKNGFMATMFVEPGEALKFSETARPDLAIVNPATIGYDIRGLRTKWPNTKIVAVADQGDGRDLHEVLVDARRQGADLVVRSSLEPEQLVELADFALSRAADKPRALVIEDSKTYRAMLSAILEDHGFEVAAKETMEDALGSAGLTVTDLVISDIFMPGEGGISGIKKIRDNWPGACIVAVSGGWEGMSMEETLQAAKKIGADGVMRKPFTSEALINLARDLLGRSAETATPE